MKTWQHLARLPDAELARCDIAVTNLALRRRVAWLGAN